MGRTQPRSQYSIPQETGNMGLGWSTAAGSHPCFSRLICWFSEIHSPQFSHFSPSLFIAGFIYMNRALRVLSRQSAVAEPGAGEGGKARQGARVLGHGHLLPATWEAGRQAALHAETRAGAE